MKRIIVGVALAATIATSPVAAHVSNRCVVDMAVSSETFRKVADAAKALEASWLDRAPRDELYRKWRELYFTLILQAEAAAAFSACQNRSEDEN